MTNISTKPTNKVELHLDISSFESNAFNFSIFLSGTEIQNATHYEITRIMQHAMHKLLYELDQGHIEELPTPPDSQLNPL